MDEKIFRTPPRATRQEIAVEKPPKEEDEDDQRYQEVSHKEEGAEAEKECPRGPGRRPSVQEPPAMGMPPETEGHRRSRSGQYIRRIYQECAGCSTQQRDGHPAGRRGTVQRDRASRGGEAATRGRAERARGRESRIQQEARKVRGVEAPVREGEGPAHRNEGGAEEERRSRHEAAPADKSKEQVSSFV